MKRNWYVICTKENQEKRVSADLTKRGFNCFCPYANMEIKRGTVYSTEYLPLFRSYVFVFISVTEIPAVKKISNVINMAYWKSTPAIISNAEMDAIRMLNNNYTNIKMEKCEVRMGDSVSYIEESITSYSDGFVTIKPRSLKIVLPSLGYNMMAERANANATVAKKKFALGSLFS